jgi:single-stranded-DNA-specific exonuclease
MARWVEPVNTVSPSADLLSLVGGSDFLAHVLMRRGISTVEQAKPFLDSHNFPEVSPMDFPGMEDAVGLLSTAIQSHKRILVWGDFDVDGQTSTTLLVQTLRALGAQVQYHIPIRETESHGILTNVLAKWVDDGIDVLLTCDTGVSALDSISYTKSHGVQTIITDHHELPEELPPADCIISPHLLPAGHPSSSLPGVGVAYKLAQALLEHFHGEELLPQLLDLVALGIVADVALLHGETRALLQQGLEKLRTSQRVGLQILYNLAELNPTHLSDDHIGFVLAPRLNAVGRLSDANPVVDFLTTTDPTSARIFAGQLESLNLQRKLLCDQIYQSAENLLLSDRSLMDDGILVLFHSGWHPGVIGIVASRLVEKYNRPVILLSIMEDGLARGSARSLEGIDITAAIRSQKDLLRGFGGHTMAAGLSLPSDSLPAFRKGINQYLAHLGVTSHEAILSIDAECTLADLTLDLAYQVEKLSPYGAGNPPLVFLSRNLKQISCKTVGKNGDHRLLTVQDENGFEQTAIWWQADESTLPDGPLDLAFKLHSSNYRGQESVQLEYLASRPSQINGKVSSLERSRVPDILDYRRTPLPLIQLRKMITEHPGMIVWGEGCAPEGISSVGRDQITSASHLALWTAPANWSSWQSILQAADPETIALFCVDAGLDTPKSLLTRLSGLAKYAIHHLEGKVPVVRLAAATGHSIATIEMGLRWLALSGTIKVDWLPDGFVHLATSDRPLRGDAAAAYRSFSAMVGETRSFRQFFCRSSVPTILSMR